MTTIEVEKLCWRFFSEKGLPKKAIAGIMGNIKAESGFNPTNLENYYEKKLKMSDSTYTKKVDNGTYTNFVKDKAGYGLCQWTYWSRKEALKKYIDARGLSIGDAHPQLQYLYKELVTTFSKTYTKLTNKLITVTSATKIFCKEFENPANYDTVVKDRIKNAKAYYKKYKNYKW